MRSEFGWLAKARTPTTAAAARSMSATISCWLRSRSPHGARVKIMKPLLSSPLEPAMEKSPTISPAARSGATRSSISRILLAV